MSRRPVAVPLLAIPLALALAGCSPRPPVGGSQVTGLSTGSAGGALSGLGGVVLLNDRLRGQVQAPDGSPAAGVQVRARLIGPSGATVISQNGGRLTSQTQRALLQADALATTDAQGRFELPVGPTDVAVVEAAQGDALKAIRLGVRAGDGDVRLLLAPTGTIAGQVTAAGVTDLTGVDVYLPGTSYAAKADAAGRYELTGVPAGTFVVLAEKAGLGRGSAAGVQVKPHQRASAPVLAIAAKAPVVAAVIPPIAAPGQEVELRGQGFGMAAGSPIAVTLGGLALGNVRRDSDQVLHATLPPGAQSGDLVVTVDGVAGPALPVPVIDKLVPLPGRDALLVGESVPLVAAGLDRQGHWLGDVAASWKAAGDALVVTGGQATARAEGQASLACGAGSLVAQLALPVRRAVGVATAFYHADGGSPDRPALIGLARSVDGKLYLVAAGHEDGPASLLTLSADGTATPVELAGAPEPREVALGRAGEVYVLGADGSLWQLGSPARRLLAPADLASLLPSPTGGPMPGAGGPMPPAGGPTPPAGPVAVPKPHGLLVDAQGRLVLQLIPGMAVRMTPGETPKALPFAPPSQPGQIAPVNLLAAGGADLWAYLPRPNLAAALERVTDTPPGILTELRRDVGDVAGLAVDGQGRAYLAVPGRHAIVEVASDGTPRTLVGSAEGAMPDAARQLPAAPRQLVVDAAGEALWVLAGLNGGDLYRIAVRRAP